MAERLNPKHINNLYLKNLAIFLKMKQEVSDRFLKRFDLKVAPFQEERRKERLKKIKKLKRLGVKTVGDDMAFYLNRLSPGCRYCKMGFGPTILITAKCTRNCFYCFQYRPQDIKCEVYKRKGTETDYLIRHLKNGEFAENIINLGISGGEPLLVLEEVIRCIKVVKQRNKVKSQIRLYTNGDLVNENVLKKLQRAGLDEIRFGLKFGEFGILEKLALAKKYVPRVMMEGPVFPESEEYMRQLLFELERIKIFGINFLDLRCRQNVHLYKKKGYLFNYKEKRPFYEPWDAQGWPIYGSEEVIFNLLEFSVRKKFSISLHYCPVRQNIDLVSVNMRRMAALRNRRCYETITEEGLLKKSVIYYPDYLEAKEDLQKHKVPQKEINFSSLDGRLETHVKNLKFLSPNKYEVGVLYTLPEGEEVDLEIIKSGNLVPLRKSEAGNKPFKKRALAKIYFQIGSCYEQTGKNRTALDFYRKSLEVFAGSSTVYQALSRVYFNLKEYSKAIALAKKAVKASGYKERDNIHFLLGASYRKMGEYKKAIIELKKAAKIDCQKAQIFFLFYECYRKIGQLKRSDEELNKLICNLKDNPHSLLNLNDSL